MLATLFVLFLCFVSKDLINYPNCQNIKANIQLQEYRMSLQALKFTMLKSYSITSLYSYIRRGKRDSDKRIIFLFWHKLIEFLDFLLTRLPLDKIIIVEMLFKKKIFQFNKRFV